MISRAATHASVPITGKHEWITAPRIFKKIGLHAKLAVNSSTLWAHDHLTNDFTRENAYQINCAGRLIANIFTIESGHVSNKIPRIIGGIVGASSQIFGIWSKTCSSKNSSNQEELLKPTYSGHFKRSFSQLKSPIKNWPFTQSILYSVRGASFLWDGLREKTFISAFCESSAALALEGVAISQSGLIRTDLNFTGNRREDLKDKKLDTWKEHLRKGMKMGAVFSFWNTALISVFGSVSNDGGWMNGCNFFYGMTSAYLNLNCLDRDKLVEKQTLFRAQLRELNHASRPSNKVVSITTRLPIPDLMIESATERHRRRRVMTHQ